MLPLNKSKHKKCRIINRFCDICPICGRIIQNDFELHHIENYPNIGMIVHKNCHIEIHSDKKYYDMIPRFSKREVAIYKKLLKYHKDIKVICSSSKNLYTLIKRLHLHKRL